MLARKRVKEMKKATKAQEPAPQSSEEAAPEPEAEVGPTEIEEPNSQPNGELKTISLNAPMPVDIKAEEIDGRKVIR